LAKAIYSGLTSTQSVFYPQITAALDITILCLGGSLRLTTANIMARVYADVNAQMPRSYWDYDSVNISWGVLENYEVVRKIGMALNLRLGIRASAG
jgi:hypothetical protein